MSRSRGGQPGNQNARKHGYYSRHLLPKQARQIGRATRVQGLDSEIALLRIKLKSVAQNDPGNLALMARLTRTIALTLKNRQKIALFEQILGGFK
jgi:hypothetical protein